jgi:non-ribosomal peptide synthase protein (TIGR01720 family)
MKEQWRGIPHHGLGYGVLRYLGREWEAGGKAEVSFNYLGQFDQVFAQSEVMRPAEESAGRTVSGRNRRTHLVEVTGLLLNGQLEMSWSYSRERYRRETIEGLGERYGRALERIVGESESVGASRYTPSDFPYARVNQEQLNRITAAFGAAAQS